MWLHKFKPHSTKMLFSHLIKRFTLNFLYPSYITRNLATHCFSNKSFIYPQLKCNLSAANEEAKFALWFESGKQFIKFYWMPPSKVIKSQKQSKESHLVKWDEKSPKKTSKHNKKPRKHEKTENTNLAHTWHRYRANALLAAAPANEIRLAH